MFFTVNVCDGEPDMASEGLQISLIAQTESPEQARGIAQALTKRDFVGRVPSITVEPLSESLLAEVSKHGASVLGVQWVHPNGPGAKSGMTVFTAILDSCAYHRGQRERELKEIEKDVYEATRKLVCNGHGGDLYIRGDGPVLIQDVVLLHESSIVVRDIRSVLAEK